MSGEEDRTGVHLSVTLVQEPDELRIAFGVENRRGEPVYVAAHPGDLDMTAFLPEGAYLEYLDDVETLRAVLDPPECHDADVVAGAVPLSRRVDPGETTRGVVRVALPARPWSPYGGGLGPAEGDDGRLVWARRVEFTTIWFPEAGLRWSQPGPEEGTWWCTGSPTLSLSRSFDLDTPIPVLLAAAAGH